MTCRRRAGMTDLSTPPLRAMTFACSAGDSPSTSLTSSDDPALCALAASGMNESSSAQRTAKIRGEFTRTLLIRRMALAPPTGASNSHSDNVGRPFLSADNNLKIISGSDGHRSSSVQCVVDQQSDGSLHRKRRADHADSVVDPNASESQTLARPRRVQTPPDLKIFRLKLQN